jgi:transcriptional regulator with XRE-family HTH domain
MSGLRSNVSSDFTDRESRHLYADESLNTKIATQIKVIREQRGLTQSELAKLSGMAQPRIAVLEDINYSSWSVKTLKRIAKALDVRLAVGFETFSSLIVELENLDRSSLERPSFDDDIFFHGDSVAALESVSYLRANVTDPDLFKQHMTRSAQNQKEQSGNFMPPQPATGVSDAALRSALG